MGGLARGGKTTAASVLAAVLRRQGHRVHRVSLDGFLLPPAQRGVTVLERYNMPEIEALVRLLATRPETGPVSRRLGRYARKQRTVLLDEAETVFQPGETILVEGVVGLALPLLLQVAARRIYVETDETVRKQRFLLEYSRRGYGPAEAEALYAEREEDENKIIRELRGDAEVVTVE